MRRVLHPGHLIRSVRVGRKPREGLVAADERLRLFASILPGGFLNYGYHADPDVRPEALSLEDIGAAQRAYAQNLVEKLAGVTGPVLDVGCGMGGLLERLRAEGFDAMGVTPDRIQVEYLEREHPDLRIVHSKFEKLDRDEYRHRFHAVVNAESLQYIKLKKAVATADAILAPEGRWVICDRFCDEAAEGGHVFADFLAEIEGKFHVVSRRDITANILPTIAFVYMWGQRLGLPLLRLVAADLRRKRPGLHYLMEDSLRLLEKTGAEAIETVNPEVFACGARYELVVLERG